MYKNFSVQNRNCILFFWLQIVGLDVCAERYNALVEDCKQKAGLPSSTCLASLVRKSCNYKPCVKNFNILEMADPMVFALVIV